MKTAWNLSLLYKGHDDPQIEKDLRATERAYASFEKKYRGKTDWLKSDRKLATALADSEALVADRAVSKPVYYFHYLTALDSADAKARARLAQIAERLTKIGQKVVFFDLELGKVPAARQRQFLKSDRLARYRYLLQYTFAKARHNLSEPEEKILALKAGPSYSFWVEGTEKLVTQETVEFQGKELPFAEAMNRIADLPTAERRELHAKAMERLDPLAPVAESELNAIATDKKINDELRGFKEPYDSTILGYQNDRKSVLALVDAVTKNARVAHRYYALKAKLLKLPKLEYADRNVGIGQNVRTVTFDEAVKTVRDVFYSVDRRYGETFDRLLDGGQIDAFPKKGKRGGAFCSGALNQPTYVLLNFSGTLDDVSVLAHEMGHAIHTEFSKAQPAIYQDYSASTAEVASTLFEAFVFDATLQKLSDEEKVVMLHNRVNDDVQTVFRQIACFNFEAEMHREVRAKGALSKEELRALMNKHMSAYMGPAVEIKDADGNFFVWWHHIRNYFYVYSYAFGQLISRALYERYREDKSFVEKINRFLEAGGSDSPERIFKSIGIDVTKPDFWEKGIRSIERDIETLEKLTEKR